MAQAYYPAQGHQQHGQPPQQGMPPPPKPPRKNPYRDGISRSEQYYDLYYMIRSPNIPKEDRPPDPPPYKPHISKQKRLQQEIQKKFEKNNYSLPGNRFAGLGSFFKILFLIVVLPPYMVVYGIPKWFFTGFIPAVIKRIEAAINRAINAVKIAILRLVDRVVSPFKRLWRLIKDLKRKKEAKVVTIEEDDEHLDFLSFIAKGIFISYNATIRPVITFAIWSYKTTIKTAKTLYTFPARIDNYIKDAAAKIKARIVGVKQAMQKAFKRWRDRMWRRYIYPVQQRYQRTKAAITNAVSKVVRSITSKVKALYTGLKSFVLHPVDTTRKFYQKVRSEVLAKLQKIRQSIVNRVQAFKNRVLSYWNHLKKFFDRTFLVPARRVQGKMLAIAKKCQGVLKRVKNYIQGWIKNPHIPRPMLSQAWSQIFSKRFNTLQRAKILVLALYKGLKEQIASLTASSKNAFNRRYQAMANKIDKLSQAIATAVVWAVLQVKDYAHPKVHAILAPFRWMKRKAIRLTMNIRLGMAWASVLLRYGMRLVSDAANHIVKM